MHKYPTIYYNINKLAPNEYAKHLFNNQTYLHKFNHYNFGSPDWYVWSEKFLQ